MKRLQVKIGDDLDRALSMQAQVEGVSKADLVRRCLRERLAPFSPLEEDPLWRMVGADDYPPEDIDDIVSR